MRRGPASIKNRSHAAKYREDLARVLEAAGYTDAGQVRDILKPNSELASGAPRLKKQAGAKPKWSYELTEYLLKMVFKFQKEGHSISYACRQLSKISPFFEFGISPPALRSRYHRAWQGAVHFLGNADGIMHAVVRKTSGDGWVTLDPKTREVIHLDNNFQPKQ